jgi:hypothetical protein
VGRGDPWVPLPTGLYIIQGMSIQDHPHVVMKIFQKSAIHGLSYSGFP